MKSSKINAVNLLIVDDHPMIRDGIKAMLLSATDNNIIFNISEAEDGEKAIKLVLKYTFDIVILDYNLDEEMNGVQAAIKILGISPTTKILALSNYDELYYIQNMLNVGVNGYILKNIEPAELIKAINTVLSGNNYFSNEVAVKLIESNHENVPTIPKNTPLTRRQKEILKLIAMEMTNVEISETLHISKKTVDTHRQHLLFKLDVKNTAGLIKAAYKMKLVKPR